MFLQTYYIICFLTVCFSAQYHVIWDQNYCDNKDRYPSTYKLPHTSPCALCIDDVITLQIDSPSEHYENIYRVQNEEQMMDCDAANNINNGVTSFKDMHEIEIQNAGSNPAFAFQFQNDPYYFISTSNGSQSSAQNDLSHAPNSCLQFAFRVLLTSDSNCGNYGADCVFSSVFSDSASALYCSSPTTTTAMNTIAATQNPSPVLHRGLAIAFYDETTNSPGAIAGLSIFLVICILMILIIPPLSIIYLVLYWYGKITFSSKDYFFNNQESILSSEL